MKRWSAHGEIESFKRDVASIAKAIDRVTGKVSVAPEVELFPNLPGNRYRKILARAVATDQQYAQLENRLKTVWAE
jgi:hypothetical protein